MANIGILGSFFLRRWCTSLRLVVLSGMVGAVCVSGCGRAVTITQAGYINTAGFRGRNPAERTGFPLEVNIVCVYPHDLNKEANSQLSPDSEITSAIWYKKRPDGRGEAGKFDLPSDQIYLFTDETDVYGKTVGPRLNGAKHDGKEKIAVRGGIIFNGRLLHNAQSVIYAFAKFVDGEGKVLDSPPAKFDPPGHFRRELFIEVGVDDPDGRADQYIKNTTIRHYGK